MLDTFYLLLLRMMRQHDKVLSAEPTVEDSDRLPVGVREREVGEATVRPSTSS